MPDTDLDAGNRAVKKKKKSKTPAFIDLWPIQL